MSEITIIVIVIAILLVIFGVLADWDIKFIIWYLNKRGYIVIQGKQ